ncbi:hypothetical protein QBC47DRAFT_458126 [Echria macrotheca]|uniref:Uncharacterized protein n=1 Tax=Echria macrotheca TaxID=438768 RepID=A0AAJ0FFJ1_9PEZI|nr:hypothetical protein QBC47DRAFT_458126 [Echria macrotheca]
MDAQQPPKDSEQIEQMRVLVERLVQELQRAKSPPAPSPKPPPVPEPRVLKWLKTMMPTFIAIFGFGGQITFTVIPTITKDDDVPSAWGAAEVRAFLSLAWMFFTLGFGLSCAMALIPAWGDDDQAAMARLDPKRYERIVNSLCAVLHLFAALAFLFVSLVVAAYTPAVGWINVGVAGLGVLIAVVVYVIDTWLTKRPLVFIHVSTHEKLGMFSLF